MFKILFLRNFSLFHFYNIPFANFGQVALKTLKLDIKILFVDISNNDILIDFITL